jgi:hypothetical protein
LPEGRRYWLLLDSIPAGPFSAEQLHFKLLTREITWQTLASPVGATTWLPLAQVPGLGHPAVPVQPPGSPPSPAAAPRRALDIVWAVAMLLSFPFWFLNEYIGRPFFILAGLIWAANAVLVVITGRVPSFTGRVIRQPGVCRSGGVVFLGILGLVMIGGGAMELFTSRTPTVQPVKIPLKVQLRRSLPLAGLPSVPERPGSEEKPAGKFSKAPNATRSYEGKRRTFALFLTPDTWVKKDPPSNPHAEVQFVHKDGEAHAFVVAERTTIPLRTLKSLTIDEMKTIDKEAKVLREERRIVNDSEVLSLTVRLTIEGVPFVSHGYYYSGPQGSIQIVTVTPEQLFNEYEPALDAFLNGFEVIKSDGGS